MMTREEAIEHLLHDGRINLDCDLVIKCDRTDDFFAAVIVAIDALKGPTREMVERMRGEWLNATNYTLMGFFYGICSKCRGRAIVGAFCNKCGAPMTDEAVDIIMKRLEALKDGKE